MLGVNTDASLRAVLRQIEADGKRPDLLLATGDLSQDGEPAAYRRLAAMLGAARRWTAPASVACPATTTCHPRCARNCPNGRRR